MTDAAKTPSTREGFWPHLFDPFREFGQTVSSFFSPSADAAHTTEAYEINLELPGVDEKDIDVSLHDDLLSVKGEKKFEQEKKEQNYYFSERRFGTFQRTFRLPADGDADHIDAHFEKGVLKITIPKLQASTPPNKEINIRTG